MQIECPMFNDAARCDILPMVYNKAILNCILHFHKRIEDTKVTCPNVVSIRHFSVLFKSGSSSSFQCDNLLHTTRTNSQIPQVSLSNYITYITMPPISHDDIRRGIARVNLDDYEDNEPVYAIGRQVNEDGTAEYFHGPVEPPSGRRGPDLELLYEHGRAEGFHRGFHAGERQG